MGYSSLELGQAVESNITETMIVSTLSTDSSSLQNNIRLFLIDADQIRTVELRFQSLLALCSMKCRVLYSLLLNGSE